MRMGVVRIGKISTVVLIVVSLDFYTFMYGQAFGYTIGVEATALRPFTETGLSMANYTEVADLHTNDGTYTATVTTGVRTGSLFNASGVGLGTASVDLASGTLRAYTESSGGQWATANASFSEQLFNFRWADPTRVDPIRLGFTLSLDASFNLISGDSIQMANAGNWSVFLADPSNGIGFTISDSFGDIRPGDQLHFIYDSIADSVYIDTQIGHTYSFGANLFLSQTSSLDMIVHDSNGNPVLMHHHGAFDMLHTGTLGLILPVGALYESTSGIFLTQSPTASVPEPLTLALVAFGLLFMACARGWIALRFV